MTNGRSEPDVELHPWRSTTVQEHRPDGCLCYRATLDQILSDDMMAPVLRAAGYEPDKFREMMTEMAGKGEMRCSSD
jgi:hypothetical protein